MTTLATTLIFFIAASIILCVACETSQSDIYDSREMKNEANKRPFFVGSRYGRSQYYGGSKALKQVNVVPRNDRFFLGSRYGKRANEDLPTDMLDEQQQQSQQQQQQQKSEQPHQQQLQHSDHEQIDFNHMVYLPCMYTGLSNLYRCYHGQENISTERYFNSNNDDVSK